MSSQKETFFKFVNDVDALFPHSQQLFTREHPHLEVEGYWEIRNDFNLAYAKSDISQEEYVVRLYMMDEKRDAQQVGLIATAAGVEL